LKKSSDSNIAAFLFSGSHSNNFAYKQIYFQ
jgi:hypothetical protein